MSIITALYTLLIKPLELLFEVIYVIANRIIQNPGLSIIALSLAMNFLVLPLYRRADAMQAEQRDTENRLNPWITHIKKAFSGDKQFMILQEFYRQNHYKPTYALRGSLSLLLEIPFFIAAYRFLSSLELLQGVSFGPLTNLGAPDGLIKIGSLSINVLPVLMTAINIVSGAIYTKGMPAKSKIQLYAMALVFLVFLYDSPSGLVFYWTLNNLFSLVKNIFYKLKNPKRTLFALGSIAGVFLIVFFGLFYGKHYLKRRLFFVTAGVVLQLPLLYDVFLAGRKKTDRTAQEKPADRTLFILAALICTMLLGILIPSAVIASSPDEFVDVTRFANPLSYLWYSGLLAAGTCIIWAGIFYFLAGNKGKYYFSRIYIAISGGFLYNYMVYGRGQSNLSASLQYEEMPKFTRNAQMLNLLVVVLVILLLFWLAEKLPKIMHAVGVAGLFAIVIMSGMNIVNTNRTMAEDLDYIREQAETVESIKEDGLIHLTKDGQNVVMIMLDRAMGCYIPYIMEEKPELKEAFDGFTYYSNVMSFGRITVYGAPAMMAGYEYTPEAINSRTDETFLDKYNESSRLLPYLFDDNGFDVTVCDPPLAGLEYVPNLKIYEDHPDIQTYMINKRQNLVSNDLSEATEHIRQRNFFCFAVTKVMPLALQNTFYDKGLYNEGNAGDGTKNMTVQIRDSVSTAYGLEETFMNTYSVMHELPNLTKVEENGNNQFFFICNEMTHEVTMLQEPDYVPAERVDNTAYDADIESRYVVNGRHMIMTTPSKAAHYDSNMCAMLQLAKWFDYLREEGVYDNTRIILVSDHGTAGGQFDELKVDDTFDAQEVACLLMVKDFGATGFTTRDEFMTNADTPGLVLEGLVENPVNPFTGKAINSDEKYAHDQIVLDTKIPMTEFRDGYAYPDGHWYSVHDDIWNKENWTYIGEELNNNISTSLETSLMQNQENVDQYSVMSSPTKQSDRRSIIRKIGELGGVFSH